MRGEERAPEQEGGAPLLLSQTAEVFSPFAPQPLLAIGSRLWQLQA